MIEIAVAENWRLLGSRRGLRFQNADRRIQLQVFGHRQLGRTGTLIRKSYAKFLVHQHRFVGQLQPDRAGLLVFQANRTGRGCHREHAVFEVFTLHVEIPRSLGIGRQRD